MRSLPIKMWAEFQQAVSGLDENSSSRYVLGIILNWIRSNYECFMNEPFLRYGFDRMASIDEGMMPVEFSTLKSKEVLHFRRVILKYHAKNVESIARFLRDSIENLITIETDNKCPVYGCWGMIPYVGRYNDLLAFQCKVCGHAHYSNGNKVGSGELEFATTEKLKEFQLI